MATARAQVKHEHEQYNVKEFIAWHRARYKSAFRVVAHPDPPDAIIQSRRTVRWVESTTAFWTQQWAIDQYTYATPGEAHKPIPKVQFYVGPDGPFVSNFVELVRQKLEKTSYEPICAQYGPGYLVVRVDYPLFGADAVSAMRMAWGAARITNRRCFRSIYVGYRSRGGLAFMRWPQHP